MNEINQERLPAHIAIIMDGNGRWANQRNLSRAQGHLAGVKRVEEIVDFAQAIGIKVLTLYTFSTENWKRPETEVNMLFKTITAVINYKIEKLKNNNMKFQILGRQDRIPDWVQKTINYAIEETKANTGLVINLAFNYGARLELVDAVKKIAGNVKQGVLSIDQIDEKTISQALYTAQLPDPDLLIRTSGEKRISNFLLWQLSYSELYFSDLMWPDFTKEEFKKAIIDYQNRERRFGKIISPSSDESRQTI